MKTGLNCPIKVTSSSSRIRLSQGSGGREMQQLIKELMANRAAPKQWEHTGDDGASYKIEEGQHLVFTTDAFTVTPLFFKGGNIGKLAFCGTVNDLAVMGAKPIGLSLSLVIEEGLPKQDLREIVDTMHQLSKETGIPIVTGDTKVMQKASVDKLIITTSGIGMTDKVLGAPIEPGDQIIVSGSIGEHGAALLSRRFEIESEIESDSKPLVVEIGAIKSEIKMARDVTRGGLAAVLNELGEAHRVGMEIVEEAVPIKREVATLTDMLGIEVYHLACEGRLVCVAAAEKAEAVVAKLRKYHPKAAVIGKVVEGSQVVVQTKFGKKILSMPTGDIVPRIC